MSSAADLVTKTVAGYAKDRRLCLTLALAFGGSAAFAYSQLKQPEVMAVHAKYTAKAPRKPAGEKKPADEGGAVAKKKSRNATIDAVFMKRMAYLLRIVVPGLNSKSSMLLCTQSTVLVARTLLSLRMARRTGDGLTAVLERSWTKFGLCLSDFFVTGVCAAITNSALKYFTNSITVEFRQLLTERVHGRYLKDRAYYKAAVLRLGNLDNADQRIVEDLNQWCHTAADLFSRTFKPALDVTLATARMGESLGYSGLAILYTYFVASGFVVRAVSPPFGKYIAQQQMLEGDFRRQHSRLITHAEEVAFLDGAQCEEEILNEKLNEVTTYSTWYYLMQFKQGIIDQYTIKYLASMVGWPVIAVPFILSDATGVEAAARYREADTLIQQASSSITDLMMVYKKVQKLAGFTARVVELIEAVDEAEGAGAGGLTVCDDAENIRFEDVDVKAPDGRLLVKGLTLDIKQGQNILVTGANGAGKTSMFRVLAGLWPAAAGNVVRPASEVNESGEVSLFYVPQRPYLVSGTLRDQVMYPARKGGAGPTEKLDREVRSCLERVGLAGLVDKNPEGLDHAPHDWADVLSGGEKQRVGLARLLFHAPRFAILDEATSAMTIEGEAKLYDEILAQGTTVFSIAHRKELRRFHQTRVDLAADGTGAFQKTKL
mmetsp:Transcript_22235/g.75493  ORF Transcript_22235/g.75493 Transcript_22235/m.75493 type:complete len:659 (-) Transcript_22235:114-2090(-)